MLKKIPFIFLCFFLLHSCQKVQKLSKVEQYFANQLEQQKSASVFEEDSEYGYIKIGNFLNPQKKSAIVASFDSITSFKVYELKDKEWQEIFCQKNASLARINELKAYIEDYNFDGIKDIAIKNEVSNGTAIMTFHLWLSKGNTFKYVPEFEAIGNPTILKKSHIIRGFDACCAFTEINISDYIWIQNKLIKTSELKIGNYAYGTQVKLETFNPKKEEILNLTRNDISDIIHKYSENWMLTDTAKNDDLRELKFHQDKQTK